MKTEPQLIRFLWGRGALPKTMSQNTPYRTAECKALSELSAKVQDKNHVLVLEAVTATPLGGSQATLFQVRAFKNSHEAYNPPTALPHLTLKLHPRDGRGAVLGGLYADFRVPKNEKSESAQVLEALRRVKDAVRPLHPEEKDSVLKAVKLLCEQCPFLDPGVAASYIQLIQDTSI